MTSTSTIDAIRAEFRWCLGQCRAPVIRGIGRFAIEELIIPEGKYRGEHFRYATLPFTQLLHREIDSGRWTRSALSGCVQGGKSLQGYVLPCLWHIYEHRESVVLAAPTIDLCRDKWFAEILPAILAVPRFRAELPDSGAGSRGGMAEEIAFRHGPRLKFMSAHGGDEKRSSYTARVVVATEVDKMDRPGQVSRETSPLEQIESRSLSYDDDERRTYFECTVSIEAGAIWSEIHEGSASRIVVPCPECGGWVTPEREHLLGWRDAPNKPAARAAAHWGCPACGATWDDRARRAANRRCELVHRGQSIDAAGRVTGDPPATDTLGFRWNAFNNLLWSTKAIAAAEWSAARKPDEDGAEKKMRQFYWAIPWCPPDLDETPLDPHAVADRKGALPQGILPADTTHSAIGIDLGKYQSWFFCLAGRADGSLHCPDYGIIENHVDELALEVAVLTGLREFRDVVGHGWGWDGKPTQRLPDRVAIDSGWLPDVVFRFTGESGGESGGGRSNRFLATIGRGSSVYRSARYTAPKKTGNEVRQIGSGWYLSRVPRARSWQITFDADRWKLAVQEACRLPIGEPGALALFDAAGNRHNKLSRHLTSERLRRVFKRGKGEVDEWEKSGANHWLDAAALALMMLDFSGFRSDRSGPPAPDAATGTRPEGWMSQRTRKKARR